MIITTNLLVNYDAPEDLIKYFEEKYPDGEEIDTLFENEQLNLLHFIIKYFEVPGAIKAKYAERCNIINSSNIYTSRNVINSHYIVNSAGVSHSEMIQDSMEVASSHFVYNSSYVTNSRDIWESRDIVDSTNIILSKSVDNSYDILSSQNIAWSQVINNSTNIEGAQAIYKSNNLMNCMFCGFCNNLNNSLFCIGINDKNYQIFNQDVDFNLFEQTREQLIIKLENEDFKFISVNPSGYHADERYKVSVRFDHMFENLSSEFYGWVSSLPNFSEELFMSLFFRQYK